MQRTFNIEVNGIPFEMGEDGIVILDGDAGISLDDFRKALESLERAQNFLTLEAQS